MLKIFLKLSRLKYLVSERGVMQTTLHLSKRAYRFVFFRKLPTHPFDIQHGTDTSRLYTASQLASGHQNDSHITAYVGTAPSVFRQAIARWQATLPGNAYTLSDYAFMDIGCGKGRVVLLATETAFHSVSGIELNPRLASIAAQNLARWMQIPHACAQVQVHHADALSIELPAGPVLLFLYNPFDAVILQRLLDRLSVASLKRIEPIDILYAHPDHAGLVAATAGMRCLWRADLPLTAEDKAADPYLSPSVLCHQYRLDTTRGYSAEQ